KQLFRLRDVVLAHVLVAGRLRPPRVRIRDQRRGRAVAEVRADYDRLRLARAELDPEVGRRDHASQLDLPRLRLDRLDDRGVGEDQTHFAGADRDELRGRV